MGDHNTTSQDWDAYAAKATKKTRNQIFTSYDMDDYLNPLHFKVRESRDSAANPLSTPIIVGLDVTGSMGILSQIMIKKGMPTVFTEVYKRKPVSDPHIAFAAIGDMYCDRSPLQMTQFETSIVLTEQLSRVYLEGGGGGNGGESYPALWLLAALKTSTDCFEKRGKKGFIFTVGDEAPHEDIEGGHIARFIDNEWNSNKSVSAAEALAMAQRMYNVYHIILDESSYIKRNNNVVYRSWRDLLGENVISLSDQTKLAEVIVSIMQMAAGHDVNDVANSWSGDTSIVVADAIRSLKPVGNNQRGGLVKF